METLTASEIVDTSLSLAQTWLAEKVLVLPSLTGECECGSTDFSLFEIPCYRQSRLYTDPAVEGFTGESDWIDSDVGASSVVSCDACDKAYKVDLDNIMWV